MAEEAKSELAALCDGWESAARARPNTDTIIESSDLLILIAAARRAEEAERELERVHRSINGRAPHDKMGQCIEEWISDAKQRFEDDAAEIEELKTHCTVHNDSVHGAEAEQLRSRLESLIADSDTVYADGIRRLLDDVDACDSLAFLERTQKAAEERAEKAEADLQGMSAELGEARRAAAFLRTHGDVLAFGLAMTTGSDAETVSEERKRQAFAAAKALGEATRP